MTKEQQLRANKRQGEFIKDLRKQLGEQEFNARYVGKYNGHVRKCKSTFNSAKFGIKSNNQVDKDLLSKMSRSHG